MYIELSALWFTFLVSSTFQNLRNSVHHYCLPRAITWLIAFPVITNVVSSNPADGEVYSIEHYVIKFVNDLRQVDCFLCVVWFPPPIKLTTTI